MTNQFDYSGFLDFKEYDIMYYKQDGTEEEVSDIYSDAIYQYITAASSLCNSTLESFDNEHESTSI